MGGKPSKQTPADRRLKENKHLPPRTGTGGSGGTPPAQQPPAANQHAPQQGSK